MKRISLMIASLGLALVAGVGCTTTAQFKMKPDTTVMVTDRKVGVNDAGMYQTSPFFWTETGGAKFRVYDKNGKLVRSGKLKTHFRVVSIFWPPVALIYWPMGFEKGAVYDLTKSGDGYYVADDATPMGPQTLPGISK
jgi:hypothetical protein